MGYAAGPYGGINDDRKSAQHSLIGIEGFAERAATRPAATSAPGTQVLHDRVPADPSVLAQARVRVRVLVKEGSATPAVVKSHLAAESMKLSDRTERRMLMVDAALGPDMAEIVRSDEVEYVEITPPPNFEPIAFAGTIAPLNRDAAISHRVPELIATYGLTGGTDLTCAIFDEVRFGRRIKNLKQAMGGSCLYRHDSTNQHAFDPRCWHHRRGRGATRGQGNGPRH